LSSDPHQEAVTKTIGLNDDNPDGIARMNEYLYTLQVPALSEYAAAKLTYIVGDKYNLPALKDAGCAFMYKWLQAKFRDFYSKPKDEKTTLLGTIGELSKWTYPDTAKFKEAVIRGLVSSAGSNLGDTHFVDFMWRNREFGLVFMRSAVGSKAESLIRKSGRDSGPGW